jgi:hypothetical protein
MRDLGEVHARMLRGELLTQDELTQVIQRVGAMNEVDFRILSAQAAVLTLNVLNKNVKAIETFDRSSEKLSNRIYWLTWVLVVLTAVIGFFTILLWRNG